MNFEELQAKEDELWEKIPKELHKIVGDLIEVNIELEEMCEQ